MLQDYTYVLEGLVQFGNALIILILNLPLHFFYFINGLRGANQHLFDFIQSDGLKVCLLLLSNLINNAIIVRSVHNQDTVTTH